MAKLQPSNHDTESLFHRVYGSHLSDADTSDYMDKITRLFSLLIEIDERNKGIQNGNNNIRNTNNPH